MKYWDRDELRSGIAVPEDVMHAAAAITDRTNFCRTEAGPHLIAIGKHVDEGGDDDPCVFEAVLELAPGVILPVNHGLVELIGDASQGDEAEGLADEVARAVVACMPQLERLADILHLARTRARKVVAGWMTSGIQCDLVEVRLATYDRWLGEAEPGLTVLLQSIDAWTLQQAVEEVHVETIGKLEQCLAENRESLDRMRSCKAELYRLGASGTVSQLALNAIARLGDEPAMLRRFATEYRFWLPDGTCLLMSLGKVQTSSSPRNRQVEFFDDRLTIPSLSMPATHLKEVIGRPVTEIIRHEYLSDDIIVAVAEARYENGLPYVAIRLDMPGWLFCSASGRTWRMPGSEKAIRPPVSPPWTSSVFPFPTKIR